MLIKCFEKITVGKNKRSYSKIILLLQCDNCKLKFEHSYAKNKMEQQLHFHNHKCANEYTSNQEITKQRKKDSFYKNHGVYSAFELEATHIKAKQTKLERYNNEYYRDTEKAKQTRLERYGYEFFPDTDTIKQTKKDRHGDENFNNTEKAKQTKLERYGYEYFPDIEVIKQIKKDRYGDENYNNRPKAIATCQERYDVDYPIQAEEIKNKYDFKEIARLRHKTMKENGLYRLQSSKLENEFYGLLCEYFVEDDINRFKHINNWNIDFYIKSIDTYIQFDGAYWHGLNRDIEVIKQFTNERDKIIYSVYLRDIEQNDWFEKNKLKLIRVIDKIFIKNRNAIEALLKHLKHSHLESL